MQPWPWAMFHCGKDIENRDWKYIPKICGLILIHAGKTIDRYGYDFLISRWFNPPSPDRIRKGGIVGAVDIVDCVTESVSPWFFGRIGLVLENRIELPFFPVIGQLGFFEVDYEKPAEDYECGDQGY